MRPHLLAVLVGISMMAQPALAQSDENIADELGVTGRSSVSDDPGDHGLHYGVKVPGPDESAPTDPGQIVFGNFRDQAGMRGAPFDLSEGDRDWAGLGGLDSPSLWTGTGGSDQMNVYTTLLPGLRLGAGFAPFAPGADVCRPIGSDCDDRFGFGRRDVFELGVAYGTSIGNVGVMATGTYLGGEGVGGTSDLDDWSIGANVSFGAFTVGAAYVDRAEDEWGAGVGASFTSGSWGVDATYTFNETVAGDGSRSVQSYGVGATYSLAPGLTLGADLLGFDGDTPRSLDLTGPAAGAGQNGWVAVTEIKAAF